MVGEQETCALELHFDLVVRVLRHVGSELRIYIIYKLIAKYIKVQHVE